MDRINFFITNHEPFLKHAGRMYSRAYTTFETDIKVINRTVYVFSLKSEGNIIRGFEVKLPSDIEQVKLSNFISIVDFDVPEELKEKTIDSREYFAHHIQLFNGKLVFNKKLFSKQKPKPQATNKKIVKAKPKSNTKKSGAKTNANKSVQK